MRANSTDLESFPSESSHLEFLMATHLSMTKDVATAPDESPVPENEPRNFRELVNRVVGGDREALAELFLFYRPRLWRIVHFRLHPRLQGRVDADDVLQDAWLKAESRIKYFLSDASRSAFIWFRMIVTQALIELHRRHLGAEKRTANRERSIHAKWDSESTSTCLSFHLLGNLSSPSNAMMRAEQSRQLDTALQTLSELDREILALRHFEELTNHEAALVLELTEQAASARYVRALQRLKRVMETLPSLAKGE
jgi:RNA polymerase sigma-70 factor, ECF subfamily